MQIAKRKFLSFFESTKNEKLKLKQKEYDAPKLTMMSMSRQLNIYEHAYTELSQLEEILLMRSLD